MTEREQRAIEAHLTILNRRVMDARKLWDKTNGADTYDRILDKLYVGQYETECILGILGYAVQYDPNDGNTTIYRKD